MKRLALLAVLVILLLAGGGLTSLLLDGGGLDSLFIVQTAAPDSSVLTAAPWQTEQLMLMVGFLLFNLVGMGLTIAIVLWLLHRGVKHSGN